MKTIEIEHGDLLEEYFSREMFRLFQIHAHFKFLTDVVRMAIRYCIPAIRCFIRWLLYKSNVWMHEIERLIVSTLGVVL